MLRTRTRAAVRPALRAHTSRVRSFSHSFEPLESRHLLTATVVEVTTFDDVVDADDGLISLREAVLAANASPDDYEIQLPAGTYPLTIRGTNENAALTGNLNILDNGSLTIVGASSSGTTIDATALYYDVDGSLAGSDSSGGIFEIRAAEVHLQGVTMRGGAAGFDGGAIHNTGHLTLTDSGVVNNLAILGGGISNRGQMIISGTTISDNLSILFGAGGGVHNDGEMTITRSTIARNGFGIFSGQMDRGGGIYNTGELTVSDSTVSGNFAKTEGAGIYSSEPIVIRHSTITGNRLWGADGGGINAQQALLEHTIVAGNFGVASVGDVPTDISGTLDPASSYNLIGDPATAGGLVNGVDGNIVGDGLGGVLDINTVLDPTLADNGGPTLTHALVEKSPAINAGDPNFAPPPEYDQRGEGFARVIGGRIDIGAVESTAPSTPIDGMIVVDIFEDILDPHDGLWSLREAVIYANNDPGDNVIKLAGGTYELTIQGSFEDDALTGDLDALDSGSLQVLGAGAETTTVGASGLFNEQLNRGDRLFDIHSGAEAYLEGLTLTGGRGSGPTAQIAGGAIQVVQGQLSISQVLVTGNKGSDGGGVYASESRVSILDSSITENVASGSGNGLYARLSETEITNSTISHNSASLTPYFGGGIHNAGGPLTITGSVVSHNSAVLGGGVSQAGEGLLTITDTMISDNVGGGIRVAISEAIISDSVITRNSLAFGAGVQSDASTVSIIDTVVSKNRSVTGLGIGGGIHNNAGKLSLLRTRVVDNEALTGGGIHSTEQSVFGGAVGEAEIVDSTISGNAATHGGGIYNLGVPLTIVETTIDQNTAVSAGGGLLNAGAGEVHVERSTFSNNSSQSDGGGIYNATGGTVVVTNSTLSGNEAGYFGGGIFNVHTGSLVELHHSTVVQNRANVAFSDFGFGGGIYLSNGTHAMLDQTIVAGNIWAAGSPRWSDIETDAGGSLTAGSAYNLIGDPATAGGLVNGVDGNIVGDGLGDVLDINSVLDTTLADNGGPTLTHALIYDSPAINAGDPNFLPPPDYDQRGAGFPRVQNGRIDIGAVESLQNPPPVNGVIFVDVFDDSLKADGLWSLREAVIYANNDPGDNVVQLSAGTYPLTILGIEEGASLTGNLNVLDNGSLRIVGAGSDATVIDASLLEWEEFGGIFTVDGGHLELDRLKLTGGEARRGGAIANFGQLAVANSTVTLNSAERDGGAIFSEDGTQVTVEDSTFADNSAREGGAIHVDGDGELVIGYSNFFGNLAGGSGGAVSSRGSLSIDHSTISGNSAGGDGGGLYHSSSEAAVVTHSTFSGNIADRFGGAIGGRIVSRHNTITGNRADADGLPFFVFTPMPIRELGGGFAGIGVLEHTILAGNFRGTAEEAVPDDYYGNSLTGSYNLIGDPATAGGLVNGVDGNIVGDGLGGVLDINTVLDTTLADNGGPTLTHALISGSPAINTGDPNFVPPPEYDQRGEGFPRVIGGRIDVGAVESTAPSTPVDGMIVVDIFEDILDPDDGLWSLREAVIYANNDPGDNVIKLSVGTYKLTIQGTGEDAALTGNLNLLDNGSLKIVGAGASATTIDASELYSGGPGSHERAGGIFEILFGTVHLKGMTLRGGAAGVVFSGGAIANLGHLTLSDSEVVNNLGGAGGGIYNDGQMVVERSTIADNYLWPGGIGGGIYNDGEMTIRDSTIADNGIGGPFGDDPPGGAAFSGGGIYNSGPLTLTNSTVSGNHAERRGGGIYSNEPVIIRNSTITGNRLVDAVGSSGGGGLNAPQAQLEHTIVAGNFAFVDQAGVELPSDVGGTLDPASSYNLIGDPATAGGLANGVDGNIVGDGLAGVLDINTVLDTTLADNGGPTLTHALISGSPAVNAGDPNFAPPPDYDQRGEGFARVTGGRIDIGAYEFGSVPVGTVLGRYVFYNNSSFDGHDAGINLNDNNAVDFTKQALLPGGPLAGPQNVTSYSRGLNGIMIDIAGSHPNISADDFMFHVGANNAPGTWSPAPALSGVVAFATPSETRVVLTWPDGAIKNTYLQVIVAANADTGLASPDVFFFGNRIGDTFDGTPPSQFVTNAVDEVRVRNNQPAMGLSVSNAYDFDKNGRLDAVDMILARNNIGMLSRIQIPTPPPPSALDSGAVALALAAADAGESTSMLADVDQVLAMEGSFQQRDDASLDEVDDLVPLLLE